MGLRTRIHRVTLPRYELEYAEADQAVDDSRKLRDSNVLMLEHPVPGELGTEFVLDLAVVDIPVQVTLLFRIIQRSDVRTICEWWARRTTDLPLLSLFIESLQTYLGPMSGPVSGPTSGRMIAAPAVAPAELQRLLEICRRALSRNPFAALNVHWSAGTQEIARAVVRTSADLEALRVHPGARTPVVGLANKALEEVQKIALLVAVVEGRSRARTMFVPADQLRQARELAVSKLEMARLREDAAEVTRVEAELDELGVKRPK